jgi:predicted SpoU family rRNA methylase
MKSPKYTAKQIDEIIDRITASADASVCRGTTRVALDRYKRAPYWIRPRSERTALAVMLDVKSVVAAYF